jgi:hypothetical protein
MILSSLLTQTPIGKLLAGMRPFCAALIPIKVIVVGKWIAMTRKALVGSASFQRVKLLIFSETASGFLVEPK